MDIFSEDMDLEAILLKPLEATANRTFTGWKSLPLQHSWDDCMNINQNFSALCKYEKFKKDYKYVVQNEGRLIRKISDYKQYKANKARKLLKMRKAEKATTRKPVSSNEKKKKKQKR